MKYTKSYFNKNNEEVPSTTTILKILNKPNLIYWANILGFKKQKVDKALNDRAELGTAVHSIIHDILTTGGSVYDYDSSKNFSVETVQACIDNFYKWYNSLIDMNVIYSEKEFVTDLFGGTIDLYCKLNGKYTIIDFKTSKKIRLTMFLQLAMYIILLETNNVQVDQVGIVLVNESCSGVKYIEREKMDKYIELAKLLISVFHMYYNITDEDNWEDKII